MKRTNWGRPCTGHATIGGLGPLSRLWGSALDHVLEVEVVLANSTITRASDTVNPDIFFVRVPLVCPPPVNRTHPAD